MAFQLKKTEIINFVTLRLTNLKFLKIVSFLPFLTQIEQNLSLTSFKCGISSQLAMFALHFHSGVFTTTALCFERYFSCKIRKEPILIMSVFFTFFTTLGLIWPEFAPRPYPLYLSLLVSISNELCQGIQLILITLTIIQYF